ncbi:DUF2515 family protein [Paenibacillus alkalitolerans]|uniref:DUF2515 family protein n=1 Tax=Paenibacillus alkalitolerans TaxID=2799335 RepID=UPI0018F5A884
MLLHSSIHSLQWNPLLCTLHGPLNWIGYSRVPDRTSRTFRHFSSLHDRILLEKRLYSIIFKDPDLWRRVFAWAANHPHTGSRKDYWPHLFTM